MVFPSGRFQATSRINTNKLKDLKNNFKIYKFDKRSEWNKTFLGVDFHLNIMLKMESTYLRQSLHKYLYTFKG